MPDGFDLLTRLQDGNRDCDAGRETLTPAGRGVHDIGNSPPVGRRWQAGKPLDLRLDRFFGYDQGRDQFNGSWRRSRAVEKLEIFLFHVILLQDLSPARLSATAAPLSADAATCDR